MSWRDTSPSPSRAPRSCVATLFLTPRHVSRRSASTKKFANRPCLGYRKVVNGQAQPYEFLSYHEVGSRVAAVAAGYVSLGLGPKDRVGVIGPNSVDWMVSMQVSAPGADQRCRPGALLAARPALPALHVVKLHAPLLQAMNRQNMCCVPLYDTLGEDAVEYIIRHSEAKAAVADASKLPVLAKALAKVNLPCGVVYWGTPSPEALAAVKARATSVVSLDELVAAGKASPVSPVPPSPSDMSTIMYTSGTTGDPKGVMLTHAAVVSTIASAKHFLQANKEDMTCEDVFLSYLPLAHIFDRVSEEFMINVGACIGYWQGG